MKHFGHGILVSDYFRIFRLAQVKEMVHDGGFIHQFFFKISTLRLCLLLLLRFIRREEGDRLTTSIDSLFRRRDERKRLLPLRPVQLTYFSLRFPAE